MTDPATLRLSFAAAAGAATFFAPCAYPLLPGYVAFFLGVEDESERSASGLLRAVGVGLLASMGVLLVFAVLGGVAAVLGARALRDISVLEGVVGLGLVVIGVVVASGRGQSVHVQLPVRRRTPSGIFAFGVVYALAAAGCTAPVFVGVVLAGLAAGPVGAAATLTAYAGGLATLLVAVTVLAALGRSVLLTRLSVVGSRLTRVAGALLAVAGLVQLWLYLFRYGGLAALGLV